MKTLLIMFTFLSSNAFAVEYKCHDEALKAVVEYLEYESTDAFYAENDEIFFCKSKVSPDREIFQWGDGSGLVGIEFVIKNEKCEVEYTPYTGQDDQDLDYEWATSYCQDFNLNY